jgi:hypothetical protein
MWRARGPRRIRRSAALSARGHPITRRLFFKASTTLKRIIVSLNACAGWRLGECRPQESGAVTATEHVASVLGVEGGIAFGPQGFSGFGMGPRRMTILRPRHATPTATPRRRSGTAPVGCIPRRASTTMSSKSRRRHRRRHLRHSRCRRKRSSGRSGRCYRSSHPSWPSTPRHRRQRYHHSPLSTRKMPTWRASSAPSAKASTAR